MLIDAVTKDFGIITFDTDKLESLYPHPGGGTTLCLINNRYILKESYEVVSKSLKEWEKYDKP